MSETPTTQPMAYADPNESVGCAKCLKQVPWQETQIVQGQRYCVDCAPVASAQLGAPVQGPHDWTPMEGIPDA